MDHSFTVDIIKVKSSDTKSPINYWIGIETEGQHMQPKSPPKTISNSDAMTVTTEQMKAFEEELKNDSKKKVQKKVEKGVNNRTKDLEMRLTEGVHKSEELNA